MTLIGRAAEVDAFRAVLRRAAAGSGAAAVIEGEPGVGKTRLLCEFVRQARAARVTVFHGAAEELARTRPFGVLFDALTDVASPAAELLDSATFGDQPQGSSNVRYRVVEGLLDRVERAASSAPVALVLDDLQWADPASVLTLQNLTRRFANLPIALVAAMRPMPRDEGLDRLLEGLHALRAPHLRLRPLDQDSVIGLLAEALDADPGPNLLALFRRAGGNPFYVHELVRTLRDGNELEFTGGTVDVRRATLPVTLGTTILRHLRFLRPDTLEVLQHAAVLGTTFAADELAAISGRSIDRLLEPLQEAVRAELVHDRATSFGFRHDLVREALYERIPRGIRRQLHASAGRALATVGVSSTRVATQFSLGAAVGDAEAISFLRAAVDETQASAPEIAIGFLRQAIGLTPPSDRARDAMRADLACLLVATGYAAEAYEMTQQVLTGEHDGALDGVLSFIADQALFLLGHRAETPQWLERATESGSLTDVERSLVFSEAAITRVMGAGDVAGAEHAAQQAARFGDETGDRYAQAFALSARSVSELFRGDVAAAVNSATLGVELARGATDPRRRSLSSPVRDPHVFHGLAMLDADRLDEAEAAFRAGEEFSTERGVTGWCHYYHFCLGLRHYHAGAWDDAVAELETGLSFADELGNHGGTLGAHVLLALVALHRDDLPAGEGQLSMAERRFAEVGPDFGMEWLPLAQSYLAEANGDVESACACLGQAWDTFAEMGCRAHYRMLGPQFVRYAVATGHTDRAKQVTLDLETLAGRQDVPSAKGAALHCRALLDGNGETARAAVNAYRDSTRPLPRAAANEDAAIVIGGLDGAADARPLFTAALDGYRALGAVRDASRVIARMREFGIRPGVRGPRQRSAVGWESLTPTELRIVELVAAGLSNPEIGSRLFVSRRTVQTHVSHIFAKVQLTSRAELAAEAARRA